MSVRSGQTVTTLFTTRAFATGAAANADSTPAGTLYVNGTADAASVAVTNLATGVYKAAVTLPTLAVGDLVELRIAATVSTVSDSAVVWRDAKDADLDASGRVSISGTKNTLDVLNDLSAAAVNAECDAALSDVGLTLTVTGRIDAAVTSRLAAADYAAAPSVADVWTSALAESYAADGAAFTPAQALYEICQALTEFVISGTTITVKKRDGSATAMTYTLNSATAPTSRTRAT